MWPGHRTGRDGGRRVPGQHTRSPGEGSARAQVLVDLLESNSELPEQLVESLLETLVPGVARDEHSPHSAR